MSSPLAVAIAFFALGANLLGTGLLLLFNPRSRGIRWYAAFGGVVIAWLLTQGLIYLGHRTPAVWAVYGASVHMLPAFFVAYALVQALDRPLRDLLGVIATGLVLLGIMWNPLHSELTWIWQSAGWGTAGAIMVVGMVRRAGRGPAPVQARGRRVLEVLLLVMVPVSVIVGWVAGGTFFVYSMPLLTVGIQFLVFVGVIRHSFYDVEVRAARTGEIAAQAAEQERLAVVGELSASLAHEIRNPLTGARSLAQRLAEEEVDEARRRRYAAVIVEEMERVERLVANLLGVAKRSSPPPESGAATPLAPLLDDLLLLLGSRAARAGVQLSVDGAGVEAPAPREPLAQALLNLMLNALAHSPRGTAVEVRARQGGAGAEITVRDSGPGIPREERERIWEPFYTRSGGTGLGLAVVRRLAREHGWRVEVGDAPGGGAEFTLKISRDTVVA